MAADTTLSARFTAQPGDPVLGAQQLLASLAFVHFENASVLQPRGEVVAPPPGWQPSATFLDTLLGGLSGNPALSPVTLDQLLAQVPVGGNDEPKVRHLQAGPAGRGITRGAAQRILLTASSWPRSAPRSAAAPQGSRPSKPSPTGCSAPRRAGSARPGAPPRSSAYTKAFSAVTGQVTLATEQTVTFTARQAAIPVTILSAATYPVTVVVTLTSDKFTFPDGSPSRSRFHTAGPPRYA